MIDISHTRTFALRLAAAAAVAALAGCGYPADCDQGCQASIDQQYAIIGGSLASYRYTAPAPVFIGCTRTGNMVNCLGQ